MLCLCVCSAITWMSELWIRSKCAKILGKIILQSSRRPNNQSNYLSNGKCVLYISKRSVLQFDGFSFNFISAFTMPLLLLLLLRLLWFSAAAVAEIFDHFFLIYFLRVLHWPSLHDNMWQSKISRYITLFHAHTDTARCGQTVFSLSSEYVHVLPFMIKYKRYRWKANIFCLW